MTTYTFYEITHAAGVPHAHQIGTKKCKTEAQAIRAAQKLIKARLIVAFANSEAKTIHELQNTETGAEFVKADETRKNSPYFKYLFS